MGKTDWCELPPEVRGAVQREVGRVSDTEIVLSGKNADATLAVLAEAGSFFVKGSRTGDVHKMGQLRREAAINPYVTHVSPALRFTVETAGWLVLGFDRVDGRRADYGPGSPDIPLVVELVGRLAETPCPAVEGVLLLDRRMSNHMRPEHLRPFMGNELAHTDMNPGNVLIGGGRAHLVDWACPTRAVPWTDAAGLALCLITSGHCPADAEAIMTELPVWKALDPDALDLSVEYKRAIWSDLFRKPTADPWVNSTVAATQRWSSYRRHR